MNAPFSPRLTAAAARLFGRRATVLTNRRLSPRLRLIRFAVPAVDELGLAPAVRLKVEVEPGALRSYTPAAWSADEGWVDMTFFVHGDTPGSRFATRARFGSEARFVHMKPSFPLDPDAEWALCLGDETTLGLFRAVTGHSAPGTRVFGAIELDEADAPALAAYAVPLTPLPRDAVRGRVLRRWLATTELPEGRGVVYLSGHGGTARDCWEALQDRGLARDQIRVKPYWNKKEFTR